MNSFLASGDFRSSLGQNIHWLGEFSFFPFSIPSVRSGEAEYNTQLPSTTSFGECAFRVGSWVLAKAAPKSKIRVCGMGASRCDEPDLLQGWCSSALSRGLLPVDLLAFGLGAAWIQLWNDLALQATQRKVCDLKLGCSTDFSWLLVSNACKVSTCMLFVRYKCYRQKTINTMKMSKF